MIVPLPSYYEKLLEDNPMAKQKLTPEKRAALRKELATKLKAGIPRVKILQSLSDKFGISTEGMRWYWNAASSNGTPKKALHKAPATKVRVPKPSHNGNSLHLPGILTQHTEGELKRILAAKKLVPHLEAATRREQELRRNVKRLSRELRAENTKARQLQRQIKTLTQA
jgi:hypothetical protein